MVCNICHVHNYLTMCKTCRKCRKCEKMGFKTMLELYNENVERWTNEFPRNPTDHDISCPR